MTLNQLPDDELIKELYARYGLAYFHSECLHRELCCIYTIETFQESEDITRPRVEEKMVYTFSLTLGAVTKQLTNILPEDLFAELEGCIKKRNFLAHHFWFDRAHLMVSTTGINSMIKELNEFSQTFIDLDRRATKHAEQKRRQLGITDEMLEKAIEDVLAGKPMEPICAKRKLKKTEQLVRVWVLSLPNGKKPFIFETEDGCLWQLCDVGFGWTDYDTIGPDWHEEEIINEHLPANINPRPKDAKSWNYEFCLKQGTVLWMQKGKQPKTFVWGIRTKDKYRKTIDGSSGRGKKTRHCMTSPDKTVKDFWIEMSIREIWTQSHFAEIAFNRIQPKSESGNDAVFSSIHSFLSHCAKVSKMLEASDDGKPPKSIGDILNIKSTSVIHKRRFRNGLEHYDERLITWIKEFGVNKKIMTYNISPKSNDQNEDLIYINHYDPVNQTFTFINKDFNLCELNTEAGRIKKIADEWVKKNSIM